MNQMQECGSCVNPSRRKSNFTRFKIFTCKFCGRKFLSPQALGGHQNAHRKERLEFKSHQQEAMEMAPSMHWPFIQPHAVMPHQFTEGEPIGPWSCSKLSGQDMTSWPGSYRFDERAQNCSRQLLFVKEDKDCEDDEELLVCQPRPRATGHCHHDRGQSSQSEVPGLDLDLHL